MLQGTENLKFDSRLCLLLPWLWLEFKRRWTVTTDEPGAEVRHG